MTKQEAIAEARKLRSEGKTVKILKHEGVHTVPGRGVMPHTYYEVVSTTQNA